MAKRKNGTSYEARRRADLAAAGAANEADDQGAIAVMNRRPAGADAAPAVVMDAHAPRYSEAPEPVVDLEEAFEAECAAVARRHDAVRAARAGGATWAELARVLQVTPQAVAKRYSA